MKWNFFLLSFNGKNISINSALLTSDSMKLYTDSSSKFGFAAFFGNKWLAGPWTQKFSSGDITLLELYPIVIAIEIWAHLIPNRSIIFMTDNMGVVSIINKQTSRCKRIMILVRILVLACSKHNILFRAKHIPGKYNVIADKFSRLQFAEACQMAPWLDQQSVKIPDPLQPPEKLIHTSHTADIFSRFKHFMGLIFPNFSTKPALKKHIAAFVAFLFKSNYSPSTITSNLTAISYMHKIAGFKDPTDSFLIRKMLIGAKNLAASLDVRLPITLDILISLTDVLSKAVESIYIQKLLASMFSLSFFAFMRVGEITLKSRKGDS